MIKKWHHVVIKTVMKGTDNYGILNCVFYVSVCINHYTEYWSIASYLSNTNGLSWHNVASTGSLKAAVLWAKRARFWIGSWPSIVSQFKVMGYKTSLRRFYQLIKLKHSLLYQTFPSIDKVKCCLICIIKSESFSLVISVFFFLTVAMVEVLRVILSRALVCLALEKGYHSDDSAY